MMSREEVFRATGPTSGSSMWVKIGVKQGRQDHRRRRALQVPGRRLPRLAGDERRACARSRPTTSRTRARSATTWCATGRRSAAYRAPGSPISRLRGGERARHAGEEDRHGPAGAAAARTPPGIGTPMIYGAEARARRLCRDASRRCSTIRPTRRRSARTRGAASPRATGSTAAASRARRCRSTPTAPCWWRPAARTSAARAPRWRSWRPRRWASTTTRCARSSPTPRRSATRM